MVKGASTRGNARFTLTDSATRVSIAKGMVSPTYFRNGKVTPRGVVQLDMVTGRNLDYIRAGSISARVRAAEAASRAAKANPVSSMLRTTSAFNRPITSPTMMDAGNIGNDGDTVSTTGFTKSQLPLLAIIGISIVAWMVIK